MAEDKDNVGNDEQSKDVPTDGNGELSSEAVQIIDTAASLDAKDRRGIILEIVSRMTLLEASELVKDFEERFGVSAIAAAPVAAGGPQAGAEAEEAAEEEKTSFNVILKEIGPEKIKVVKVVRSLTTLGLKEAKALVDGAPGTVKEGVSKEDAEKAKEELESVGATVEIE